MSYNTSEQVQSKGEVRYLSFTSADNFNAIHTVELCISAIDCVKSELLNKVYVRHFSNLIKSGFF